MVAWVQAPPAGTGARPHPLRRERDLTVREAVISFFSGGPMAGHPPMFPGGVDWEALDRAIPRLAAHAAPTESSSSGLAHVIHQSPVTGLIGSATRLVAEPVPPSLCGHIYRARCTMPGHGRRACFSRCALLVEHLGRCCCAMHNADPWPESINTDPLAKPESPNLAVDSSFGDLLIVLAGNNAIDEALPLWRADFKTLRQAIDAGKPALMRAGLSVEVADAIVRRHPCVAPTGNSVDLPADQELSTAPEPSRPDHPALAFTTRGKRSAADARLATQEGREAAHKRVDDLCYARSARGARCTLWGTWVHFAVTHWGLQPLPLTERLVRSVAASLRAGGYRAVEQYYSRARQEHLRSLGEAHSNLVEDAIKMYTRAPTWNRPQRVQGCMLPLRAPRWHQGTAGASLPGGHQQHARGPVPVACRHGRHGHMVDGTRGRDLVRTHVPRPPRSPEAPGRVAARGFQARPPGTGFGTRASLLVRRGRVPHGHLPIPRHHGLLRAAARALRRHFRVGDCSSAVVPGQERISSARRQSSRPSAPSLCRQASRPCGPMASGGSVAGSMSTSSASPWRSSWQALGSSSCSPSSSPVGAARPSCGTYLQQAPLSNQQGVARAAIRGLALKDVDRLALRMMECPDMPQGAARKAVTDSALQVELRDVTSDTVLVNYNALAARIMLIEASVADGEGSAPGPLLGVRRRRGSKLHLR